MGNLNRSDMDVSEDSPLKKTKIKISESLIVSQILRDSSIVESRHYWRFCVHFELPAKDQCKCETKLREVCNGI